MFPIVCTVAMDAKFIDAFLRKTYESYPEAPQELYVITTTNASAYRFDQSAPSPDAAGQGARVQTQGGGPMVTPSRPPWTIDVQSAFPGQSAEKVAKALRQQFAGTELDLDYFAILDAQSLRDGTAVVARSEGEDGFATVRLPFGEVNAALGAWSLGEGSLEDALHDGAPAQ